MRSENEKKRAERLRLLRDLFFVVSGSLIFALGFQFFMYPNAIVAGGVSGVSMIVNYLTGFPVGVLTILLNIPLFALSWKRFGLRFILLSLLSMVLCSVFVDLLATTGIAATEDPLLGAIYGGVVHGFGMGVVYLTGATTGGIDIVAKFLRHKYQHINFGTLILALDFAIILAFALIFGRYESAMYAMICMFITTKVVDLILYGAVNSKVCYVITDYSEQVKDVISEKLHRGVTFLHGEGAWSGDEKKIILCVIKQRQIVDLKRLVGEIDPAAFLIVSDSREVFGEGFSYIGND